MRVDATSPRPTPTTQSLRPAPVSRDSLRAERPDRNAQVRRGNSPVLRARAPEKLADLVTAEEKRFIQRLFPSASTGSTRPYDAVEAYTPRLGGTIDVRG